MNSIREAWGIDSDWTLFLDRDGTINRRKEGYIQHWSNFSFLHLAPQSIARLNQHFRRTIIVTNQQGIDKELMTHEELAELHRLMLEVIEYFEGHIDAIFYDPSLAELASFYRKPNPGMGHEAKKQFPEIDFQKSIMVGDTLSDMLFGKNLGMKTIWIENEWEKKNRAEILKHSDKIVHSLTDLCDHLM